MWVDVGERAPREALGTLKFCLVGKWKDPPDKAPSMEALEEWAIKSLEA